MESRKTKIVIISRTDHAVWRFRRAFVATLVYLGHDVTVISPDGPYVERLRCLGCTHERISLNRFIGGVSDISYPFGLYRILRRIQSDIVYTMTTKPNIVAPLITKLACRASVCSVFGGLGFIYSSGGNLFGRIVKSAAKTMMRFGTRFTDHFVFQNTEDRDEFWRTGLLKKKHSIVVNGSGVNLREFSCNNIDRRRIDEIRREFGVSSTGILVVMISRIAQNKGILDFIDASTHFSDRKGNVRFIHVGSLESGSLESVLQSRLAETPLFKQVGFRTDIQEIIQAADVVALPSYHREGIPNVLVEAGAMKRAVVTTDNIGCRDVVEHDVNGLLVPIKNPAALAKAIRELADNPAKRKRMGEAGFEKVKQQFIVESVNRKILEEVFGIIDPTLPEFFTEEIGEHLCIHINGHFQWFRVPLIGNDHELNTKHAKQLAIDDVPTIAKKWNKKAA